MENNELNSCFMLAVGLYTPVDLGYLFELSDLKDTGIELDSHITLLYAQNKVIDKSELLSDVKEILEPKEYNDLLELCKESNLRAVNKFFYLDLFENDSDYIVLKLRKDTEIYKALNLINKGLRAKYQVTSEFKDYTPHITLAEFMPGEAKKYLESPILSRIIAETAFDLEDFMISYGRSGEIEDRKKYFLTQYKNVDRYFRIERLKKLGKVE